MARNELRECHSHPDGDSTEEAEVLLSNPLTNDEHPTLRPTSARAGPPNRRQSSFSKLPPHGQPRTPRTSNRVRFDVEEHEGIAQAPSGHMQRTSEELPDWLDDEDYFPGQLRGSRGSMTGQREPLLTSTEAPSVTVANTDLNFNLEDLLENARPKSGMRSAFMNMANSIIMLVIIITVITQGPQVPEHTRGNLKGSLFIRNGVFQAIGVISFGT
ncbi:MAG: hypothetical protein Q9195_000480 [Heterodermia aff. obscurata]